MSIHKTPAGTFQVRYRDETDKNRAPTFKTEREAKRHQREVDEKKDKGERVNADRSAMKLSEFWENVYLPTVQLSVATKKLRKRVWGRQKPEDDQIHHLRKKWGDKRLSEVNNREVVLAWHDEMAEAGASDAAIFKSHSLLVGIVTHAVTLEYLGRCKISGIQPDYEPADTGDPWLPVDIEAIRQHLLWRAAHPPKGRGSALREVTRWRRLRDTVAVSIMGYAALRIGECFALQWPMILDRDDDGAYRIRRYVEITSRVPTKGDPENRTKTSRTKRTPRALRKPRIVELESALRDDLREWWMLNGQPTEGYVLPVEPGGVRFEREGFASWTRDVWNKSVKACGLPPRPPKHLRLSCVSMWIRERRDEGTVADMAGHSVAVMWNTYRKAFLARMNATEPFDMAVAIRAARTKPEADVRDRVRELPRAAAQD